MDLGQVERFQKLELRPRTFQDDRVTSFKLKTSLDGVHYDVFRTPTGAERIFGGPKAFTDFVTVVLNATDARFIRLYPLSFLGYMAVKWEIYSCQEGSLPKNT